MSKAAADFEKMIHADRAKKKNEALAARIFGKDRRNSAPPKTTTAAGGSLASRSGVKKRLSTQHTARPAASNINGSWTHDLHDASSPAAKSKKGGSGVNSLASRITVPGAIAPSNRHQRRAAQVAQALIKTELQPASTAQGSNANAAPAKGMTIRGLAGPFAVMAQNFAPGTTAADIESAVTPVGGLVSSCKLLKTQPIVIAEIVFESREGAERVIDTFNNQTADGRVLHVYPKVGGFTAGPRAHQQPSPSQSSGNVVDGSMGFDEPMEMDAAPIATGGRKSAGGGGGGSLYSDKLVTNHRGGRGRRGGVCGGAGRQDSPGHDDQYHDESGGPYDEPCSYELRAEQRSNSLDRHVDGQREPSYYDRSDDGGRRDSYEQSYDDGSRRDSYERSYDDGSRRDSYERSYDERRYNEEQVPRAGEYSQHSHAETSYTEHHYSNGSNRWNEYQDQRFQECGGYDNTHHGRDAPSPWSANASDYASAPYQDWQTLNY